ncbi:CCA tRNA nucleotidyltransferase [Roseibium denhamense]|uniref:Poly(A) polymerase n=1 Tax=Roseibium denhamense TaxID=76305 RepID=A0ABY1NIG4_9HYPH|nr:CCA tRNA nucleotidyltransferase [Roseibium denhamense]MTI06344.1 CCA tRNA nucleotidyltransferase [Roseibium denhamense]SMP08462.1 poly(A) polymerase [Roseibium denhamense]
MPAQAERSLAHAYWLQNPGIQAVFSAIETGGDEARVVGGAVRNTLLSHDVPDIDIATTASPQDVMDRAARAGLKPVGTGIDHGTVTIVSSGFAYEVTTLREDVETFGRQARVVFGRNWENDAKRRDFTMNALYADRDGQLFDPLGGLDDCLAGRVRFIGDPDTRIREDYLRILRFFRIYAAYGSGDMDQDGLGACLRQRDGLRHLSPERIGHEMRRLMKAKLAATALRMMSECGLWEIATGGLARTSDYEALRSLDDLAPETRDPEVGLTVLAGFVREDLERIADRFRLSNAERKRMQAAWAAAKSLRTEETFPSATRFLYEFGRQGATDGLLAFAATALGQKTGLSADAVGDYLMDLRSSSVPEFPLKGADLLAIGCAPGPELGRVLAALRQRWIDSGFDADRGQLLDQARSGR